LYCRTSDATGTGGPGAHTGWLSKCLFPDQDLSAITSPQIISSKFPLPCKYRKLIQEKRMPDLFLPMTVYVKVSQDSLVGFFELGFSFYFGSWLEGMSLLPFIQSGSSVRIEQHRWPQLHSQHPSFSAGSLPGQQLHQGAELLSKMSLQVRRSKQAVRTICAYQKMVLFREEMGH